MSSVFKNFQKLLVFFFATGSVVLVIMGISRSKANTPTNTALGNTDTTTTTTQPVLNTSGIPTKFTGRTYQTPWGNVVAGISVSGGKIVGVTMPQVPNSPPSQYAEPILVQQALTLGSANIQGVSGATYTSIAFKSSLEDAIAQAGSQGQTISPTTKTAPLAKPSVPRSYREDDD